MGWVRGKGREDGKYFTLEIVAERCTVIRGEVPAGDDVDPASCRAGMSSFPQRSDCCASIGSRIRWISAGSVLGAHAIRRRFTHPLSACRCGSPATLIMKNSSRLLEKMETNLIRSMRGWTGAQASERTLRLNSSQESSRLMKQRTDKTGLAESPVFPESSVFSCLPVPPAILLTGFHIIIEKENLKLTRESREDSARADGRECSLPGTYSPGFIRYFSLPCRGGYRR